MDEKTEELRDLFIEVTEADTVTETQEESHGSLASEAEIRERLASAIADMRADLGFETGLDDADLVALVRRFYADDGDAEIAAALDADEDAVAAARLDLHLLRDDDADPGFDLDALRDRLDDSDATADAEIADALDADEATVRWHRRVLAARTERQRVTDRYRDEFRTILQDRDLAERMTENVQQDGLEDATDGMENELQL